MDGWTEIVIRGYPGAELAAAFSEFDVIPGRDGYTSLVGRMQDQPELIAVLTSLDDIHVPVVAVRTIDEADRHRISSSAGDVPAEQAD
jgi:hypothetical protein